MNLFARKSLDELQADAAHEGAHSLKRTLAPLSRVSVGGGSVWHAVYVATGATHRPTP